MVRYSVIGSVFCMFLAGSVWLVQDKGRTYRESLDRARRSPTAAEAAPPAQNSEVEVAEAVNAAKGPAQPLPEGPPAKNIVVTKAPSAAEREERKTTPSEKPAATASPSPAIPPGRAVKTSTPAPSDGKALAAGISRWKSDPLWGQPYLTKSWKLDDFTTQDEKQLGEQFNSLILQLNPLDAGSGLRRVKEAAASLEPFLRKDIKYQFFVLNSDVVNAFSHPGGYIYVTRKLLDMIPDEEERVLEFVVGHEIAHVELRHALACLRDRDVRSFSEGTLQKLYFLIIPYGYPDDLEYAADAWIYQRMKHLDRSEHDCLKFLRTLDQYARAKGFENGRGKPQDLMKEERGELEGIRGISPIDDHVRSHPAAYDRLSHLKALRGQALGK